MIGGFRFNIRLRLFMRMLRSIGVKVWATVLMKLVVRVLGKGELHNARDCQWFSAPVPKRSNQVAIHLPDELQRYLFRAYGLAFRMICTAPKVLVSHGSYHGESSLVALRLTLR